MNIYDFDDTIYDGDSSIDFFKFCLERNKKNYARLLMIGCCYLLYMFKFITKEQLKSKFFGIVSNFEDIDKEVDIFWEKNEIKIKEFYLEKRKSTDIIISASPDFLLVPIASKLGFNLIATKVDKKTGVLLGHNCYGKEKVKRLSEMGISSCDKFYSDSLSDYPVSQLADKAFIVKRDEILDWEKYTETNIERLKRMFLNPDFFTFIAIGVVNVLNGIWIAYVYSLFIKNAVLAYIFGFLTSLTISYTLNSLLNFKKKLAFSHLFKFIVNNIPNFIIQVTSVTVLFELLNISKLVVYSISAIIAVPVTYVLVKINVFKNGK